MGGKRVPLVQGVNDLATLRPDLLDDWDWDENSVNPDFLQLSSNYYAHWICHKCGHKWVSRLDSRTKNNHSCPMCSRSKGSSVADYTLYSLLKTSLKCEVLYRYNVLPACEADVYIPSKGIVIEYDGYGFHKNTSKQIKDREKDRLFKANGFKVYRIVERKDRGDECYLDDNIVSCPEMTIDRFEDIKTLMIESTVYWGIISYKDVSEYFKKLKLSDIRSVVSKPDKDSSLERYLNKGLYWDYEKNGKLKPDEVFAHSRRMEVFVKCAYGHSFKTNPRHISDGYGCPICSGRGGKDVTVLNKDRYYNLSMLSKVFSKNEKLPGPMFDYKCPFCSNDISVQLRTFSYDKGKYLSKGCSCTKRFDSVSLTLLGIGLNNKIYYCVRVEDNYFVCVAKDTKSDYFLSKIKEKIILNKLDVDRFNDCIGDYSLLSEEYNGYNSVPINKEKVSIIVNNDISMCYSNLKKQKMVGFKYYNLEGQVISITKKDVVSYIKEKLEKCGIRLALNRTIDGYNTDLSNRDLGIMLFVRVNIVKQDAMAKAVDLINTDGLCVLTDDISLVDNNKGCFKIKTVDVESNLINILDSAVSKMLRYYDLNN